MSSPETLLSEATRFLHAGRTVEARTILQDARLHFPQHPGLALALADSLHAEGRLPEAIAAYRVAQTLNPNAADAWYGAGCAQLQNRAYGDAFLSLTRATVLVPHSAPAYYNLGKTAFELGHVDTAIAHFRRAAALDPAFKDMSAASIACIIPGSSEATQADIGQARRDWAKSQPPPAPHPWSAKTQGGQEKNSASATSVRFSAPATG